MPIPINHSGARRVAALVTLAVACATPARAQSPATAAPTLVIVVRHAEKSAEGGADPTLTPAGEARARALADALADAHVDAVLSTPYKRTQATAAPTAARAGLTTELVPITGGTPAHASAVAAAIRARHGGQTVLVVEHSNTVPAVIRALGGPSMPDLCDLQFASLFVLMVPADGGPTRMVRSTYGAPDPADAARCPPTGSR